MSRFDKTVRSYFIAYMIVLLVALIPQLFSDQDSLFLTINSSHSKFFDLVFLYITYLGDGLAFALVIVFLALYSYRHALLGLIIFITTSGIAQILKRIFFDNRIRPFGKLNTDFDLYVPEGVSPLFNNSFPSGHTTTAFALAAFIILVFHKKLNWLLVLCLALLVGYSRIYLTHHFPIDVWVGSIIGTLGAFLLFWKLDSVIDKRFGDKGLLRK